MMDITTVDIVLAVILLFALGLISFFFLKLKKVQQNYLQLTQGVDRKNLEELLKQHLARIDDQEKTIVGIQKHLQKVDKDAMSHLQRVGFKRFNPFEQTGGDQSFVLVLLDDKDNGLILSSLHQRDLTRVYAKLINNGESEYKLSAEEQSVLDNTLHRPNDRS